MRTCCGPNLRPFSESATAYSSPELSKLPDFATLMPNVYAMSMDPLTIAYNTSLVPEAPTGLASLAKIVEQDPAKLQSKITTRDVNGAFGFTVSQAFTQARPRLLGEPGEAAAAGAAGDLVGHADREDRLG